jgi:hypothetical protein
MTEIEMVNLGGGRFVAKHELARISLSDANAKGFNCDWLAGVRIESGMVLEFEAGKPVVVTEDQRE